ncbi:MAG TPA: hypothetical protein VFE17_00355 [Candidatus Baltobacteraceae bacterium]|jgi:hypothetical protein|nr:hypothetical protein [Candidatus Baltobacteraceae bacterium]
MTRALLGRIGLAVLAAALSGCGGGGGSGSTSPLALVPGGNPTAKPTSVPADSNGPVTFLQNSGPLSTSGAIAGGSRQAIIAVMSSADQPNAAFALDTLTVGTPGVSQTQARVRTSAAVVPPQSARTPVEAFAVDEHPITPRLQPAQAGEPPAPRTRMSVLPSAPAVGSQANVWVQQGILGGTRTNAQVPATLLVQTAHGNIWVDNSIAGSLRANAPELAADFENAYASDTAHFASADYGNDAPGLSPRYNACSGSGSKTGTTAAYITEPADHRINVLVVNGAALGGLGGYFSAANYMTQSALNCLSGGYRSNEAPFIFVGWFGANGSTYELQEDLVRATAHELQHLINFVNHAILAPGASSTSFNGYETTFLNEGLSMLAQDQAVRTMYSARGVQFDADDAVARASAYLAHPEDYSLSSFSGIDPAQWGGNGNPTYNCFGGCYGAAYLFQRYLSDRFGGDAYTHAMETSGVVGTANLLAVTGESAQNLQADFALAMAANSMGVAVKDRRFQFGSLSLTSSYADQFGSRTQLSGVYAVPATGASTNVQTPVGGFSYVAIGQVPASGLPVQVNDQASVGGFGLMGGLSQH